MYISNTLIDSFLWSVQRYIVHKHGVDASYRAMDPLVWYINTGRASMSFLKNLVQAKPFMIGRILMKGGSTDDVIKAVKAYIKYDEEVLL